MNCKNSQLDYYKQNNQHDCMHVHNNDIGRIAIYPDDCYYI